MPQTPRASLSDQYGLSSVGFGLGAGFGAAVGAFVAALATAVGLGTAVGVAVGTVSADAVAGAVAAGRRMGAGLTLDAASADAAVSVADAVAEGPPVEAVVEAAAVVDPAAVAEVVSTEAAVGAEPVGAAVAVLAAVCLGGAAGGSPPSSLSLKRKAAPPTATTATNSRMKPPPPRPVLAVCATAGADAFAPGDSRVVPAGGLEEIGFDDAGAFDGFGFGAREMPDTIARALAASSPSFAFSAVARSTEGVLTSRIGDVLLASAGGCDTVASGVPGFGVAATSTGEAAAGAGAPVEKSGLVPISSIDPPASRSASSRSSAACLMTVWSPLTVSSSFVDAGNIPCGGCAEARGGELAGAEAGLGGAEAAGAVDLATGAAATAAGGDAAIPRPSIVALRPAGIGGVLLGAGAAREAAGGVRPAGELWTRVAGASSGVCARVVGASSSDS